MKNRILTEMNKKCPNCKLVNFPNAAACSRCQFELVEVKNLEPNISFFRSKIFKRVLICCIVIVFSLAGFYLSLVFSAKGLNYEERKTVERAVGILDAKGFTKEARLLNYFTVYRSNDNWLNASVEKENAYAATNYPFEIMTIYPDFFTRPIDDTERAAILLHEAQHLKGADEKESYEFVWKNRKKLGWTKETYQNSNVWQSVRMQTKEQVPNLFICEINEFADCTE
ncbi:MAG TPA: hypothetical protein PKY59_18615 [Pyrinomonadaceae bacterium]|nr:hypothetical protein [Pyrinomonadaceae bacterium]